MIQLIDLGNQKFSITSEQHGTYTSSFELVARMALNWGISTEELELAVVSMVRNDHNLADFGVMKTFIFSKKVGIAA